MYTITEVMVEKCIAAMGSRIADHAAAAQLGESLIDTAGTFPTATAAAGYVSCILWNSGLVA